MTANRSLFFMSLSNVFFIIFYKQTLCHYEVI